MAITMGRGVRARLADLHKPISARVLREGREETWHIMKVPNVFKPSLELVETGVGNVPQLFERLAAVAPTRSGVLHVAFARFQVGHGIARWVGACSLLRFHPAAEHVHSSGYACPQACRPACLHVRVWPAG